MVQAMDNRGAASRSGLGPAGRPGMFVSSFLVSCEAPQVEGWGKISKGY